MLREVYPEHEWLPWKFKKVPSNIGRDPLVVRQTLKYIESEKKLTQPQQWYDVSQTQLKQLGVLYLIQQMGGLYHVLKQSQGDFPWEETRFVGHRAAPVAWDGHLSSVSTS